MFLLPDYRVRQRDYLLNISRALTSQLDLGEVLRMILQAAASMLSGEVGLIALRVGDTFRVRAVFGLAAEDARTFDEILRDLHPDTLGELDLTYVYSQMRRVARTFDINLRQIVALPMVMAGDMLGILFVFRAYAGTPTENDYRLLQSFADQAAIAVHNARMYEFANQERQRLAAILDHSADGIMILDANLVVERWNRALSWMTGLPAEQAQGRPHDVVIRWKQREHGTELRQAIEGGWPGEPSAEAPDTLYVEGDLQRVDGTTISVGITYAALRRPNGDLQNVIANVRDITHFREAEQLKSTFISVISHELKTPLAGLSLLATTLQSAIRDDPEQAARFVDRLSTEVSRLGDLTNDLLTLSRLEEAQTTPGDGLAQVDLSAMAMQTADAVRALAEAKQHQLVVETADQVVIQGDGVALRTLMRNLLDNAIRYTEPGGLIELRLKTETGSDGRQWAVLSVSDNGVGIPLADQQRVFERFYRVDKARSRETGGTGLGLSIVRHVAERHGGSVRLTSTVGVGSVFTVRLPLS